MKHCQRSDGGSFTGILLSVEHTTVAHSNEFSGCDYISLLLSESI
jgi:hypothetical protein